VVRRHGRSPTATVGIRKADGGIAVSFVNLRTPRPVPGMIGLCFFAGPKKEKGYRRSRAAMQPIEPSHRHTIGFCWIFAVTKPAAWMAAGCPSLSHNSTKVVGAHTQRRPRRLHGTD
jgi:hypothetical protein